MKDINGELVDSYEYIKLENMCTCFDENGVMAAVTLLGSIKVETFLPFCTLSQFSINRRSII